MFDYVTCSTPALANQFGEYTQKPPTVLRNHIDSTWMIKTAARGKRVTEDLTIGFSGSPTHWRDWLKPSVPFHRIGKDFPEVVLTVHGDVPSYLRYAGEGTRMLQLRRAPFAEYPVSLKQFDIILCAVDTSDPFSGGKSAVKALEAMALGIVPICSRFAPYMELAEQGAPVVLVEEDSQDAWYESMRDLINDEPRRLALSAAGPVWVLKNRDMVNGGYSLWETFYREITD